MPFPAHQEVSFITRRSENIEDIEGKIKFFKEEIEKKENEKKAFAHMPSHVVYIDETILELKEELKKLRKYRATVALTLISKFKDMGAPGVGSDIFDKVWEHTNKDKKKGGKKRTRKTKRKGGKKRIRKTYRRIKAKN